MHGIELVLDQGKDTIRITRFSAGVPGGTAISLSGVVTGARGTASEAAGFQGPIQVRGQNLSRFLGWLAPGSAPRLEDGAGAFMLSGDLDLSRDRIGLERMRGEIAATAYSYLIRQLKYDDTNKELALALLSGVRAFYDAT